MTTSNTDTNTYSVERTVPYDKYEILVNNKRVLVDEHGSLFNRNTEDVIEVVKCEIVKNDVEHVDDISFHGENHKVYNYYTQMYEPYRYIIQHKQCIETIAQKFKFICKTLYNEIPESNNNPDEILAESCKFDNVLSDVLTDINQLIEYYTNIVENQTILCHEISEEFIDNMYINDLNTIVKIGLNISTCYSNNKDNLMKCLTKNSFTLLNLCVKVLINLEPRKAHSLILM